ncbi:hypothetical protein N7532_001873 [Penicillium argentinense]|uniref:Meiotically up-regulated protein Msb1/Mug8 domain-containing protein n=1 Tax=Penicillium argentinense TaxID=1131581 RepID=A0A9W9G3G1_9EURO|nr:uncharacterized protein N7532_001873 [Penicillium argentinense]KAJ5111338.1 hypothetical protein N7532_001873 [Penicillium argentinense]
MPFFSRVFRSKDSSAAKKQAKPATTTDPTPARPKWTDAWQRTEVAPEEVADLVRGCAQELKARALDVPFLLLPFRPSSDPSAARSFVRNYFNQSFEKGAPITGDALMQELRLNEPMVLCSVLKWCWSRLPGGVVTWEAYELFKVGEQDSDLARDAFSTFIPISVDSDARTKIINDFFDLLAAIAAHGKSNGLGGRKLSRYAGWWAFEHTDTGGGFEASYKNWAAAADATSHLFFAYLRSLTPEVPRGVTVPGRGNRISPETPTLLQVTTTKVVMIVDTVSPTPFSLLRRAKNFEYRDEHWHLQEFSNYEDPIKALTDECLRVLRCISSTNESSVSTSKHSTSLRDASWSRFEDIGFGGSIESDPEDEENQHPTGTKSEPAASLRTAPQSQGGDLGRPTTPSWADFMSSGFSEENNLKDRVGPLLLPPDKVLPPIAATRGQSSQSHKRNLESESSLEPAELASINTLDLDDSFWWVWITSLSDDEPATRKAVFGRCALLETVIRETKWLVLEEQVKGAAPEPEAGAQIVEKKRFFSFGSRKGGKLSRRKSSAKKVNSIEDSYKRPNNQAPQSKTSIGPDQHKRIQAAAAALQKKNREQEAEAKDPSTGTGTVRENYSTKTNSVMTLQPAIVNEASSALKWTKNYDKNAYRAAYLSDVRAGTGAHGEDKEPAEETQEPAAEKPSTPLAALPPTTSKSGPPPPPKDTAAVVTPLPPSPEPAKKTFEEPTLQFEKTNSKTVVVEDPVETQPKQSFDESSKKLKKKTGNTGGFKGMFGTGKKKGEQPPMKSTGAKEITSVAAARAALEAKAAAVQDSTTSSPKPAPVKKKPVPEKPATPVTSVTVPVESPGSKAEKPSTPQQAPEFPEQARVAFSPAGSGGPPQTRHAVECDAMSRVDTNERNAADQEFSKFDQGPLLDQPAFVTADSPVEATYAETKLPETPTNGHDEKDQVTSQAEPVAVEENRWAQIRKNAAERQAAAAATTTEEPEARVSQSDRSDEGDTSAEESIESRVARIRARVAELTGSTEPPR